MTSMLVRAQFVRQRDEVREIYLMVTGWIGRNPNRFFIHRYGLRMTFVAPPGKCKVHRGQTACESYKQVKNSGSVFVELRAEIFDDQAAVVRGSEV